jgi:hypothetical protein
LDKVPSAIAKLIRSCFWVKKGSNWRKRWGITG